MSAKRGQRVLGPYRDPRGWRVIAIASDGVRDARVFASEVEAQETADDLRAEIADVPASVEKALEAYERHLIGKGNKPRSYNETLRRLRVFFPDLERSLPRLSVAVCRGYYEDLVEATKEIPDPDAPKRTIDVAKYSADSHRNYLAEARSFLRWCVEEKRWMTRNPLDGVKGRGKRTRGKLQLTLDEARKWEAHALKLAAKGEGGAVAALMTLYMGMRASEITERRVRELDDKGRILWITDAKTRAGRRTLEVPEELRPFLAKLAKRKKPDDLIFGEHWRDWPREWVQRICREAGVVEVTAHGMRGLAATMGMLRTYRGGASPAEVASGLGHEDVRTTTGAYADAEVLAKEARRTALTVLRGGRR